PLLVEWARYSHGVALFFHGRKAEAMHVFDAMASRVDPVRHPALAGRIHWSRGTILLRAGEYGDALSETRAAIRYFGRIGERENLGAMQSQASEAEFALGDEAGAYTSIHAALLTLRPYRRSVRLHNHLYVTALAATASGFARMAVRIQDEDVAATARIDHRLHAEALLARARARTAAGDSVRAVADVSAGAALVESLPLGYERNWYEEDLRLAAAGVLLMRARPDSAVVALNRVSSFFSGDQNALRLLPALILRSEAWLALGDAGRAAADLDSATVLMDSLGTKLQDAALHASMLEVARGAFDRLVMLHVAADRPREALAVLERSRVPAGSRPVAPARIAAPAGQVAVDHALIGDTLLIWAVVGDSIHLERRTVGRGEFLRTVEGVRLALERRADAGAVRPALATLYDWLLRPVEAYFPEGTPLVLVSDGEVRGVPFAALYDTRRRSYLVEDHLLRFSGTLADAARVSRDRSTAPGAALFVADPEFDMDVYLDLQPLAETAEEVRRIAARYPLSWVLDSAGATPARLRASLPGAEIVHFAGHAVFDDERPSRSYLLLAGRGESGRLTAAELRELPLDHVRLVVLAACETQRSRGGHAAGLSGLSGALLDAGARGVVGSLWRVDEGLTRELMTRLHEVYRTTGSGAEALRAAQLGMLRSGDPGLQAPAAWAGFRHMGR
ncbi:MAG TPA: CHAT domain-containing protein, partial [Longimicrobium sp.]|nr:CHAT domain-containing protein [Longimicrobium sp.]